MVVSRHSAKKSRINLNGTMTPSSVQCKSSLDRLHVAAYAPVRSRIPTSLPNPDGRSFSPPRRFPRPVSRSRLAVPVQGDAHIRITQHTRSSRLTRRVAQPFFAPLPAFSTSNSPWNGAIDTNAGYVLILHPCMSLTATAYFLPRIEIEVCFSVTKQFAPTGRVQMVVRL